MSAISMLMLPNLANVGAGNTVTLECPVGGHTYDKIFFELLSDTSGFLPEHLLNIKCKINGKVFQEYESGTELENLNTYYGNQTKVGVLVLPFDMPHLRQLTQVKSLGIGTQDIKTFHIQMDIAAAADVNGLVATAQVSQVKPLGLLKIYRSFPVVVNAGLSDIDNIPLGARLLAIHLHKPQNDIEKVLMKVNQVDFFDLSKNLNELFLKQAKPQPRSVIDNTFSLDFTTEGTIAGAIITQGVRDLRIRPTCTNAGTINVRIEYWGLLGLT